jgi:arylsulfate sulfotransferase
MWLSSILNSLSPSSPHTRTRRRSSARKRPGACRLTLEALENRCLPSAYTFTPIADTGPTSPYSGLEVGQAINDLGAVSFEANLRSGGAGIFTRNADGSQGPIIAITSDLIRTFTLSPYMNDSGTVSFGAELRDGSTAIFTGRGQELTRIADTETNSPFSSIPAPAPRIHQSGSVSFRATLRSGGMGFFEGDGELPRILYVTGGQFSAFPSSFVHQVNGDSGAFRATLTGGLDGVFRGNGIHTDTIVTAGATYSNFIGSDINDLGTVAFSTNLTEGGQAIDVAKDGIVTTFVDTKGAYIQFMAGEESMNNDGHIIFGADLAAGGHGFFEGPDPVADKILAIGDELFGSTVVGFPVNAMNPRGLNNVGQFLFRANLADGRTVLVRADPCTVSLTPSAASPQLVGERITWTATATHCGEAPVYQFSVEPVGGPFHVVRDYTPTNSFAWAPMQEGTYDVRVTVKESYQAVQTTSAVMHDGVNSRVTGTDAVVTPTSNPLVALYSAPPSSLGLVRVEFGVASGQPSWRSTDERPSVPGKSTNFFVAGMLPSTTYQVRYVLSDGTTSSPLLFTTGSLPSTLDFPTFTVRQPPGDQSDLDQDMILHALTGTSLQGNRVPNPVATNLLGRVVWYFDTQQSGLGITNMIIDTLLPGGTVIGYGNDRYSVRNNRDVLREIDLAGDPVRETNLAAVNAQLTAMGHDIIYGFHHDAQRLPNGATLVMGLTERTVNINGTPTNYVGGMILVLDEEFQVTWAWDAFDHLDVNRGPVLGEVLEPGSPEPTAVVPNLPAIDWLHDNAVSVSPVDGNLIVSVRHQDWVIKIDYRNGQGDGHVIWRLGQDGDFTVNSSEPNPWFSHQHNAHYIDDSTLILFDNGNTRRESDPNANSRGQVWTLDEQTMTATLVFNVDLGNYSWRLGAAQRLSNGNFSFMSGSQGELPNQFAQTIEVLPDGTKTYVLELPTLEYRSYRMRTLYAGISDALAGAPQKVASAVLSDGSAQRSMVTSLTVAFSNVVRLDAGAIALVRQGAGAIQLHVAQAVVDGHSVDTLTFSGPGILGGSLADGHYTLTFHGGLVHDDFGQALDGAGTGVPGGDRVDTFFRLFGDSDGDGHVDAQDLLRFGSTFGKRAGDLGYLWYFDYDGDGRVDVGDLAQLVRRLGR